MDKNVIKQIILWQQEFVGKVRLQNRSVSFDENANYVLVGIRRAGKSYMLYQHIQHLVAQGHSREEILFVNFEDERITDIKKEDLHLIIEAYRELFSYEPIIFLDEIQNVDGWEHFARRLADEKYRVFITGSNAHMLSREIASTLGGRYLTKEIYPFSFKEYLEYQGITLPSHWELSPVKADVIRLFSDYFYFGGMSEMFNMQDKQSWLQSLYQKILYSDIVVRKGVRNEQSLRMLVRKLADSVMQPTAIKRLQNILQGNGTKITRETISSYLDYTNESYLVPGTLLMKDLRYMSELAGLALTRENLYGKGLTERQAMGILQAIVIETHPLGNPHLDYSVYLNNIILPGILILLIMLCTTYTIGLEWKRDRQLKLYVDRKSVV